MQRSSLAPWLLLLSTAAGCQDFDQRAHALGREARPAAQSACPRDDGGTSEEALGADACLARACEAPCTKAGALAFQRVCIDVCTARGGCDRDDDCGPGLRCVAIAPVLRRCAAGVVDGGR